MKPIHIFRAGNHTPANGDALEFSEDDLRASVAAYDPELHEAPITVGHPADNKPAYGWVAGLEFSDKGIHAVPNAINPDFAEMLQAGTFKKRSAAFYRPDAASNPVPGVYYLRHVAFLGAEPPAIKGLEPLEFAEVDEGDLIEFADDYIVAGVFRRLRDFFIDKFSREEADEIIPGWMVEDLEIAARTPPVSDESPSSFSEDLDAMNTEELKAQQDAIKAANDKLEADRAAHAAAVAAFSEQQAATRQLEDVAFADRLISANKLLPAHKPAVVALLASLDGADAEITFAEGEDAANPRDTFQRLLEAQPEQLDFREKSSDDGHRASDAMTAEQIKGAAQVYMKEQAEKGLTLTIQQAVRHIAATQAA